MRCQFETAARPDMSLIRLLSCARTTDGTIQVTLPLDHGQSQPRTTVRVTCSRPRKHVTRPNGASLCVAVLPRYRPRRIDEYSHACGRAVVHVGRLAHRAPRR